MDYRAKDIPDARKSNPYHLTPNLHFSTSRRIDLQRIPSALIYYRNNCGSKGL
jgi:hypothetical protein